MPRGDLAVDGKGVIINATACLSLGQIVLAAKAGAKYISVLVGRIGDEGGDGPGVLADARRWLERWGYDALLVAASLRTPGDVQGAVNAGTHCVTVPPAALARWVDHKYSRHTVSEFLRDAAAHERRSRSE